MIMTGKSIHEKWIAHHENMSVTNIHPHTPLLYSKTRVWRVIPIFLILLENIDCGYLLASVRRFEHVPTINNLSPIYKNISFFSNEIFKF